MTQAVEVVEAPAKINVIQLFQKVRKYAVNNMVSLLYELINFFNAKTS